jgi:outer membrane protein assembly factor BamD (BamD/ComL family)
MKRRHSVILLVLGLLAVSSGCAGALIHKDDKVLAAESHAKYLDGVAFYDKAKYGAAIGRLRQLVRFYPTQDDAADAQYYIGRSFEAIKEPFKAFKAYEVVIDKYPNSRKITEIIKRQYDIGQVFLAKTKSRWVYSFIEHPAVEVLTTIGDKSPYSEYADQSLYQAGMLLMKLREYDKAKETFTKIVDNYPRSEWYIPSKYQVAMSVAEGFRGSDYDTMVVEDAIEKFGDFLKASPSDSDIAVKAVKQLSFLKEQMAKKHFDIAMFYRRQHKYQSAGFYFKLVIDRYSDTSYAQKAQEQLARLPEE